MFQGIKNKKELATTPLRQDALDIVEETLKAIDTGEVIKKTISLQNKLLWIKDFEYNLDKFEKIYVVGIGKASCDAAAALTEVLGPAIAAGVVIDVREDSCGSIESFKGSHPLPSEANVRATHEIVKLAEKVTEKDLIIAVISGGGSALLCWPESEWRASEELYGKFLKAGGTITELNTVRRHLSELKGGGLARLFHPATMVGLIFSDVPGGTLSDVASGPTFLDQSTNADAKAILEKYHIENNFNLIETPKETAYFDNVRNICMMENMTALKALANTAEERGYTPIIISDKMYDFPEPTLEQLFSRSDSKTVVIGGGEARLVVEGQKGTGGRNLYLSNAALLKVKNNDELFISLASDGIDNCEAAGGIADIETVKHCEEKNLSVNEHLNAYDCFTIFKESCDAIYTDKTGSNVSDIMLYIRK